MTSWPPGDRWSSGFRLHVGLAAFALLLLGWLSTGTLAPYAATTHVPIATQPCQYLINIDHQHFLATFLMLDGAPHDQWAWSVVLRRTLYPVLAYPLMKLLGFIPGGLATNGLLNAGALVAFAAFLRRRVGEGGAVVTSWLLATYPGVHYWIGLPYSYAAIVPAILAAAMLLWKLEETTSPRLALVLCGGVGVLFLAYDLLPIFAPAALAVVWRRFRRPALFLAASGVLLLPLMVNLLVLSAALGVPLKNSNSGVYLEVLGAYASRPDVGGWIGLLLKGPGLLVQNFFASNFFFLPTLSLLFVGLGAGRGGAGLALFEKAILGGVLLLWAVINLAPPYSSPWQMRGEWVARLYQPTLAVLLTYVARTWDDLTQRVRWAWLPVAVTMSLNVAVVLGPWLSPSLEGQVYIAFYQHTSPSAFIDNLKQYGKRPLGFCAWSPPR